MKNLLKISLILFLTTSVFGQMKPMMGTQVNIAHPLSSFVGFWPMLEGSGNKVFDLSGNGQTATEQTDSVWLPGKFGSCRYFSGDDYLNVAALQSLIDLPTTYNFTLIFWFNRSNNENDKVAIGWEGADDLLFYPNDQALGDGGTRIYWRDKGGTLIDENGADLSNEWHQFAFVCRATNDHEVYRDAVSVGTDNDAGASSGFTSFNIGTFASGGSQEMEGLLDHVSVYPRALSASEIALLYREPFCMFKEGLPVSQMYSYAAPPAGEGQVIFIQMSAIPLILIITLASVLSIKWKK